MKWVIGDVRQRKKSSGYKGAIINMSFSTNRDQQLSIAFRQAHRDEGITLVASAGNDGRDLTLAEVYPAQLRRTITVAGHIDNNQWLRKSNYGWPVDIIAPASVESHWLDGTTRVVTGTSQAAPHVAGVLALFMGNEGPMAPAIARDRLYENADVGLISGVPGDQIDRSLNSGISKADPYVDAPHDELKV